TKKVVQFLLERDQPRAEPRAPTAPEQAPRPKPQRPATAPPATAKPTAPPPPASPSKPPPAALCRHCGSNRLEGRWGRYGYYFLCHACGKNTPMATTCTGCGAVGERGKIVRIQKRGTQFHRACEACGHEEEVWRNSEVDHR